MGKTLEVLNRRWRWGPLLALSWILIMGLSYLL